LAVVDLEHLPGSQLVRSGAAAVPRQSHDHRPRALVHNDVPHSDSAEALEDRQRLVADVAAPWNDRASRAGHQGAVLDTVGVFSEGRSDSIERLRVTEAARVVHGDLDRLFPRLKLFGPRYYVHGKARRAAVRLDGVDHAVRAAARRHQLDLTQLLLAVDLDPHHENDRRAGFLNHHARDGLARALVEDVLA